MPAIRSFLALCLCIALILPGSSASGAAIVVDSLADTIANDNHCTLREAIRSANLDQAVGGCTAGAGVDTIQLPAGTITMAIKGYIEDDALAGDFDIRKSVIIVGAGQDLTIIDANRVDRVFDVPTENVVFYLADLTVRGGYPTYDPEIGWPEEDPHFGLGGGARVAQITSSMTVTRTRFTENLVDQPDDGHGAGIYAGGYLWVYDSLFDNNDAPIDGGGITSTGDLLVVNTDFVNNYGYGAAALDLPAGRARFENVNFVGQRCGPLSLIEVGRDVDVVMDTFVIESSNCDTQVIANHGNLTLTNGRFYLNGVPNGVVNHYEGDLLIQETRFEGNGAEGIIHVMGGTASIEKSYFSGNSGAALWQQGGITEMTNVTVSTSNNGGSGVFMLDGALRLESVTIANLQSDLAALEVIGGQVIVHNTLIGYNRDSSGALRDCKLTPGTTVSAGYNLISVGDGCVWYPQVGDQIGSKTMPVDPLLGPMTRDEVSQSMTQPPLPGSPAIDAADPDRALCPKVDQRGIARPQGERCDIGAHEVDLGSLTMFHIYIPRVSGP